MVEMYGEVPLGEMAWVGATLGFDWLPGLWSRANELPNGKVNPACDFLTAFCNHCYMNVWTAFGT